MISKGLRALRAPHLQAIARRLGWGVGDQAVSSLSNFVMGVFVVRTLGAASFGAFTIAFLTYSLVLNASRGLSTDPLLVRYSGADEPTWRRAVAASSGTALTVGVAAGILCIAIAPFLPSPLNGAFLALGCGLPGLMLQDSWRFAFFAQARGARSFLNDSVWTVLLIGALLLLRSGGHITVFSCLLVFGATATLAAGFGLAQSRVIPRLGRVREWLHEHRTLGPRYLLENTAGSGATQLRALAVGAIAGLAAVGEIQAAMVLMGPFLVVLMGLSQVAVPEAAHVLANAGAERLRSFCLILGGGQAAAAALWAACVMVALPLGLGQLLLGSTWVAAQPLVPPIAISIIWACFTVGFGAGLRALGAASRSLQAQLVTGALYLAGGAVGAWIAGAAGACWLSTVTALLSALVWWFHLRRAVSDAQTTWVEQSPGALATGVVT